jgi:hypothetical protein
MAGEQVTGVDAHYSIIFSHKWRRHSSRRSICPDYDCNDGMHRLDVCKETTSNDSKQKPDTLRPPQTWTCSELDFVLISIPSVMSHCHDCELF